MVFPARYTIYFLYTFPSQIESFRCEAPNTISGVNCSVFSGICLDIVGYTLYFNIFNMFNTLMMYYDHFRRDDNKTKDTPTTAIVFPN